MSKRARILVDPSVQWSICGRIMLHWSMLLVCLVSIGTLVRLMAATTSGTFTDAFWNALMSQRAVVGVMLVLLPVFLRDTMKLSNRFAGPMYRLRTVLSQMAKGEPGSEIKFRNGDFWQDASTDFNVVIGQINDLKKRNADLEAELAAIRDGELVK